MNALERMEQAVRLLIAGQGDIRARLLTAYEQQLKHVQTGGVPAELAGKFGSVLRRTGHARHCGTNEGIQQMVNHLEPHEANAMALHIFELSCALSQGLYH